MPFRIIIVGGGIAGLSAAIALRALSNQITILEQSSLSTEIGATISLQPNATRIMQRTWGLDNLLEGARGTVDCGFRVYNVQGKLMNEIPLHPITHYGADRIMWHRQDLHSYLKAAAMSTERNGLPAVLLTSSRVSHCDCDAATVTLENGDVLEADLIIGADGIHSVLRPFVIEEEVKPKSTGLSAYRFMIPTHVLKQRAPDFTTHINPEDAYTSMVMAHDCRLIMGPARNGELYSVVGLVPDERMNEDPNSAQSWITRGDPEKMLKTFKDFPEWVKEMLKQADNIGLWKLCDLSPLGTWTQGRVILIGDAAHAMLPTQGQGASQAIEDAEALGAFFANLQSQPTSEKVASILGRVFKCRNERASLIQQFSRDAAKPAAEKDSNQINM
jgi:salicylate hydroxylase